MVTVRKPTDLLEEPGWVADMDRFGGQQFEIAEFSPNGFVKLKGAEKDGALYYFSSKWLNRMPKDKSTQNTIDMFTDILLD